MALKTKGKLVSTITFGNRRPKADVSSPNIAEPLLAPSQNRMQPNYNGRITSLMPGQKAYVHTGVVFESNIATLEKITVTYATPGKISSKRYGSRSHEIPSVSAPVSNMARLVSFNQFEGTLKRNFKIATAPVAARQGARVPKIIGSHTFSTKVTSTVGRLLLGSSTIGIKYVPQNTTPGGGAAQQVRRWPRDWHGDNMH